MFQENIIQLGFIAIGFAFQHIFKGGLGLSISFFFILLGTLYVFMSLGDKQ